MSYFLNMTKVVQNVMTPPRKQQWSTDLSKNKVLLIGDDGVDNHLLAAVDLTTQLNEKQELTCFNCAVRGSNMTSLVTNERPSLYTRLCRDYEYPNCEEFDVLSWVNRAHWVVYGAGANERRDIPIELLEKQFRMVMGKILEKNAQCIVVTDREWPLWETMVQKVCDELNVDLLYKTPELADHILKITKNRKKPFRIPKEVLALPTLE
jgi:hypothetical protein